MDKLPIDIQQTLTQTSRRACVSLLEKWFPFCACKCGWLALTSTFSSISPPSPSTFAWSLLMIYVGRFRRRRFCCCCCCCCCCCRCRRCCYRVAILSTAAIERREEQHLIIICAWFWQRHISNGLFSSEVRFSVLLLFFVCEFILNSYNPWECLACPKLVDIISHLCFKCQNMFFFLLSFFI